MSLVITRVSPAEPSTSASDTSHTSATTYAVSSRRRHDQASAQASARHTPRPATSSAGSVPMPTFACQKPWVGGTPSMSLRASTSQPVSGGTTNDASSTSAATVRPIAARLPARAVVSPSVMPPSLGAACVRTQRRPGAVTVL